MNIFTMTDTDACQSGPTTHTGSAVNRRAHPRWEILLSVYSLPGHKLLASNMTTAEKTYFFIQKVSWVFVYI